MLINTLLTNFKIEYRFKNKYSKNDAFDLIVNEGVVTRARILDRGRSYKDINGTLKGPSYNIVGAGSDLEIATTINNIDGCIVLPPSADAPENTIEVVASVKLREKLALSDGDTVTIKFNKL